MLRAVEKSVIGCLGAILAASVANAVAFSVFVSLSPIVENRAENGRYFLTYREAPAAPYKNPRVEIEVSGVVYFSGLWAKYLPFIGWFIFPTGVVWAYWRQVDRDTG